jgi:hypothetical protein
MTVSSTPTADHTLCMNLGGPEALHVIQQLTGVEVRTMEGKREVLFPNGSSLIPIPVIRISGLRETGIDELFPWADDKHLNIAEALRTSNRYRKQQAAEPNAGSCVSFLVPADETSDIVAELALGFELGNKIAIELFADR